MNSVVRVLAVVDQVAEASLVARERVVVEAPQALQQLVGHGGARRRLLHQRRRRPHRGPRLRRAAWPASSCRYWRSAVTQAAGAAPCATAPRTASKAGCTPGSRSSTSTTCRPKRLCTRRGSTPTSTAPNSSRANSGAQSSRRSQPSSPPCCAARAVGQLARRIARSRRDRLAVVAAHVEQAGLGALAQRHHVDARRHREQDVAHAHPLAGAVARRRARRGGAGRPRRRARAPAARARARRRSRARPLR